MTTTKIEWADMTINPVVGCSKCSPGCDNCYAERFAARLAKHPKTAAKYAGVVDEKGKWTGKLSGFDLSVFNSLPTIAKKVFVGSMTDMFHPCLDDSDGQDMCVMLELFEMYPQHTFMLLTKRPGKMLADIEWLIAQHGHVPGNLWLGVTVCNQQEADEKIPVLLDTPAAKHFVSVEPMLGPVSLSHVHVEQSDTMDALRGVFYQSDHWNPQHAGQDMATKLNWVICGGETGPNARPLHPDWVRHLRNQCVEAGTPFFFKGWGEWAPDCLCIKRKPCREIPRPKPGKMGCMFHCGKHRAGRLLDGREWNEVPL